MVIFERECPILKELNKVLKTIQGYSITNEEKEKCATHFSILIKCCYGNYCRYSPLSRFIAVQLLETCNVINTLPYVVYDPKDNHRIFGIYEDNRKIRVEVG